MSVRAWLKCESANCQKPESKVLLAKKFAQWRAWEPEFPDPDYDPSLANRMDVFFDTHEACGDEGFGVVIE